MPPDVYRPAPDRALNDRGEHWGWNRARDSDQDRDRGRGPQWEPHRDSARDGASSKLNHPHPRPLERSQTWDNSRGQGNGGPPGHCNRPASGPGNNSDSSAHTQQDLFPERGESRQALPDGYSMASKTAPEAKPAPKSAAAPQPGTVDLMTLSTSLNGRFKLDQELRELHFKRNKVNRDRAAAQSQLAKKKKGLSDWPQSLNQHWRAQYDKSNDELKRLDGSIKAASERYLLLYAKLYPDLTAIDSASGDSGNGNGNGNGNNNHDNSNANSLLCEGHVLKEHVDAALASQADTFKKYLAEFKSACEGQLAETLNQHKSMTEKLALTSQQDWLARVSKYEAQVASLNQSLEKERKKNTVLENRLTESEKKIRELDHALSQPPGHCVLAEKNASDLLRLQASFDAQVTPLDGLKDRVHELDLAVSQMQESETNLQQIARDVQSLNMEVDSNSKNIASIGLEALGSLPTEMADLKQTVRRLEEEAKRVGPLLAPHPVQLQSPTGSSRGTPDLPPSTEKWFQQLEVEREITKTCFRTLARGLGDMLEKERIAREEMGKSLEENVVEQVRARVEQVEAGRTTSEGDLNRMQEELAVVRGRIATMTNRLEVQDSDFKGQSNMIHAQLQGLEAWQANFNTKTLYQDIVAHIKATLPEGVPKSIAYLRARIDTIETFLKDGKDKRRLEAHGNGDDPSKRRRIGEAAGIALRPT